MTIVDILNPYAWVMTMRRILYHKGSLPSTKVSVPVISIGNITAGGSGKSPITKLIAEYLRDSLEKKPAIVMRGYKRRSKGFLLVSDGRQILADVYESGDEAQSFANELGGVMVVCDEDRASGAKKAIAKGADVILLDDGYQHMALRRDLNILLIDKHSDQHVIPFGKNREDITSSSDADIIIQTDENEIEIPHKKDALLVRAKLMASDITFLDSSRQPDYLKGKRVLALSTIANPERFHDLISSFDADIIPYALEDHAEYNTDLITDVLKRAKSDDCDIIITTTKDIVKSREYFEKVESECKVGVLHISYTFTNDEFWRRIESVLL
ncbi:MAG TPA: tetraacyldisaccharide 4'-kinase [Candidatus Kapabacteria bacterium]